MRKSKETIPDFYQKHRDFPHLESIHAHRQFNEQHYSEYTLDIILCNAHVDNRNTKLLVTFTNVKDIKISSLEGILSLMIRINDVSIDQMEGINYTVSEEENNTFKFYCEDFHFKVV